MKNTMNIAFSSSEYNSKYMMVTIDSIFKYHLPENITFYVLTDEISNPIQKKIVDYITNKGSKINIIHVDSECTTGFKQPGGSWVTYYRLYLHQLLPKSVDRILYLDTDILVRGNLLELYNIDFGTNAIAAAYDIIPFKRLFIEKKTEWNTGPQYENNIFCAGVVLFNLDMIRDLDINKKTYEDCIKNYYNYHCDQGILNQLYGATYKAVNLISPNEYNYFPNCREIYKQYREMYNVHDYAKIVHYASSPKPWLTQYTSEIDPLFKEWWEVAKYSIFYTEILEESMRLLEKKYYQSQLELAERLFKKPITKADITTALNIIDSIQDNYKGAIYKKIDLLFDSKDGAYNKMAWEICNDAKYSSDSEIMIKMGKAYQNGIGVNADLSKTLELLRRAHALHNKSASIELCDLLWKLNTKDTDNEMIAIARPLAEEGDRDFQARFARAYRDGRGVQKDLNKAASWMRKAWKQRLGWASWELFDLLWKLNTKDTDNEMIAIARPLAEEGNRDLQVRFARAYRDGRGVQKDLNKAASWMRKAYVQKVNCGGELFDILEQINTQESLKEMEELSASWDLSNNNELINRSKRLKKESSREFGTSS